jgi:hypothetical protein
MSWSAVDYAAALRNKGLWCTGRQDHVEILLQEQFPPLGANIQEFKPSIILDRDGQILMWYLPGILCPVRQVSWFAVH